jgi:tetratricopeptide (TPR) repeat protein
VALPADRGLADPLTLAGGALLVAALASALWLAARAARRAPRPLEAGVAVGVLWYFVILAPTSSVIPLNDPMAEHRVYLANLGLFLAMVVGGDALLARLLGPARGARVGLALGAAVLLGLTGVLVARNRLWHDELALWSDAARKAPGHFRPHMHAGNAHWARGEQAQALASYARAAALVQPGSAPWAAVQRAYGSALSVAGRHADALAVLGAAVAAAPGEVTLRETLAWARLTAGDVAGAEAEVAEGRRIAPDSAELAGVAGKAAATRGDLAEGARELERSVALDPGVPLRWSDLAIVSWLAGRRDRACQALGRFVALERRADLLAEGRRLQGEWGCRP